MVIQEKIRSVIRNLTDDFKKYPDKYLTESDVRCFLVQKLMEYRDFSKLQLTKDRSKSIPLHTEVRWYGESGRLKWRSDIVVIDVPSLRIKNGIFKIPTKGFAFNKPLAIIEIKLRRVNGGSKNVFLKKIQNDIKKLREIKKDVAGKYPCYLVILDKKKDIQKNIKKSNKIEIFYEYSNF